MFKSLVNVVLSRFKFVADFVDCFVVFFNLCKILFMFFIFVVVIVLFVFVIFLLCCFVFMVFCFWRLFVGFDGVFGDTLFLMVSGVVLLLFLLLFLCMNG